MWESSSVLRVKRSAICTTAFVRYEKMTEGFTEPKTFANAIHP